MAERDTLERGVRVGIIRMLHTKSNNNQMEFSTTVFLLVTKCFLL